MKGKKVKVKNGSRVATFAEAMVAEEHIERVDFNADGFHLPNALIIAEWFVMHF